MLKRGMVRTAGAAALRIPHPITRVIGAGIIAYEVGSEIYRNLTNYSKGGKDAVTRGARGGGGRGSGPGRVTREYGKGEYWDGLRTSKNDPSLEALKRKSGGEVRFDGEYYYKFDPFHKTQKVHLHKYRYERGNRYKLIGEVDPVTGKTIRCVNGEIDIW
jgi:hypothetical protein